jgi:hypothetical protein
MNTDVTCYVFNPLLHLNCVKISNLKNICKLIEVLLCNCLYKCVLRVAFSYLCIDKPRGSKTCITNNSDTSTDLEFLVKVPR